MDIEGSKKNAAVKVTGMPGKHVPPGVLGTLNDLVEAVSFCFCLLSSTGKRKEGKRLTIEVM